MSDINGKYNLGLLTNFGHFYLIQVLHIGFAGPVIFGICKGAMLKPPPLGAPIMPGIMLPEGIAVAPGGIV